MLLKGEMNIRVKRFDKFKDKYKKQKIAIKILCLWYAMLFCLVSIHADTNAAFNSFSTIEARIPVNWEIDQPPIEDEEPVERIDKSSLSFINNSVVNSCTRISQEIINSGDEEMLSDSIFYIYYNPDYKNPINPNKLEGELIHTTGIIPALKTDEKISLEYDLSNNDFKQGSYVIVGFHSIGHPGNKKLGGEIVQQTPVFGNKIDVKNCGDSSEDVEEEIETNEKNDKEPSDVSNIPNEEEPKSEEPLDSETLNVNEEKKTDEDIEEIQEGNNPNKEHANGGDNSNEDEEQ